MLQKLKEHYRKGDRRGLRDRDGGTGGYSKAGSFEHKPANALMNSLHRYLNKIGQVIIS